VSTTVGDVFDAELLVDAAALVVGHVVAIETGGDALLHGGVWQQITGQLLDAELVKGHVRG
jgi:hypothetical protein